MKLKFLLIFFMSAISFYGNGQIDNTRKISKKFISIDDVNLHQSIDGFGVNITPAQWHNGKLKKPIDLLVDNLGATLFRFDCVGLANWLDPEKRNAYGKYPESYLKEVYQNKIFKDAWQTFRYLNAKNIIPQFNVSGRIPKSLGRDDNPLRLGDFDGYAEMLVTMLDWARNKEHLTFHFLSPFNETDLGFPEGAKINPEDVSPALHAIVKKLDEYGLQDIKLIVMDDANVHLDKLYPVLRDSSLKNKIAAFGTHTYGNGADGEGVGWFGSPSNFKVMKQVVDSSMFKDTPCWMTEYGDLDQSNEIEFEFAWRSTRRLMKLLSDGFSGAEAWDAFDNFHEHDTAWAQYGLLKTDTLDWTYTPKHRFYAAKQIYKFVKPGYILAEVKETEEKKFNIYKEWQHPLKNIRIQVFLSPDKKNFTIVGMSDVEADVELNIKIPFSKNVLSKKVNYYRTSRSEYCKPISTSTIVDDTIKIILKEKSIFTLTTSN